MENCFSSSCLNLRFFISFWEITLYAYSLLLFHSLWDYRNSSSLYWISNSPTGWCDSIVKFLPGPSDSPQSLSKFEDTRLFPLSSFLLSSAFPFFEDTCFGVFGFTNQIFIAFTMNFLLRALFRIHSVLLFCLSFWKDYLQPLLSVFENCWFFKWFLVPLAIAFSVFRWFSVWLPENQILLQAIFFAFRSLWGSLNSCSCLALLYSIRFVMSIGFSKKLKKFFVICF